MVTSLKKITGEVKDLKSYYNTNVYGIKRTVRAVDDVSFNIFRNEVLGIAGESGCGKSTLIKTLGGIINPPLTFEGGEILYNLKKGTVRMSSDKSNLDDMGWQNISYVLQGSMGALNPIRKIIRTFEDFWSTYRNIKDKKSFKIKMEKHLKTLGLPPKVLNAYPHQLSGGMKQRLIIALATIFDPEIILADEPTTALDVIVQRGVMGMIQRIKERSQCTIILVTHNMAVHAKIATRLAIMYAGMIVEIAKTKEIFEAPKHPYTRYLINSLPKIGEEKQKGSLPGSPPNLAEPPNGCRLHPRCPECIEKCKSFVPELKTVSEGHKGHKVRCFLKE